MNPVDLMRSADARGSRSSALGPLHIAFGTCITGLIWAATRGASTWVQVFLAVSAAVFGATEVGSYIYFMRKRPDFLRSERYALRKLEISKGLIGDNSTGLREPIDLEAATTALSVMASSKRGHGED